MLGDLHMTKRETLTENMRRLSNIVNEAEQLDEVDIKDLITKGIQGGAEGAASVLGRFFARHFKAADQRRVAADQRRVAGSTVRQLENIQDLANSLARELGDDPSQWAGKLDNYFAELRQGTVDKIYDRNFDQMSGYAFPSPDQAAHRRMNLVMRQFDKELDELVKVTARYAQDPYDEILKSIFYKTATKTAKSVLEKIRRETPSARHLPANHLKALYQEMANIKDNQVTPRRVRRFLAGLVAFLAFAVYVEANKDEFEAEQEKRRRENPDIHYRYPDTPSDNAPNPFDGGTNTTPRRGTGSRVYFPDSD